MAPDSKAGSGALPPNLGGTDIRSILSREKTGISTFFQKKPRKRKFLIKKLFPYTPLGIIGAPGGLGKGFLVLLMAITIACGIPLFNNRDYAAPKIGQVLILSVEDPRSEQHRRILACVNEVMRDMGEEEREKYTKLLSENIHIPNLAGHQFTLYPDEDKKNRLALIDYVCSFENVKLLILDPANLLLADDLGKNDVVSRFMATLRTIHKLTKASILLLTHSNKASMYRDDDSAGDSTSVLGAVSIVNASRIAYTITLPSAKMMEKYNLPGERAEYAVLRIAKANYLPPKNRTILLHREKGGAFRQVHLTAPDRLCNHFSVNSLFGSE